MSSIGTPELLIILIIALIVVGLGWLPKVGGNLGRMVREFREGVGREAETGTPDRSPRSRLARALDEVATTDESLTLAVALNVVLEINNITKYRLAEETGLDRSTITRICDGTTEKPHKETLLRILGALALPTHWRDELLALAGYPLAETKPGLSHPSQVFLSCHGEDLAQERRQIKTVLDHPRSVFNVEVGSPGLSFQEIAASIGKSDYLVMVQGWRWMPVRQIEAQLVAEHNTVRDFYFQKEGLTLEPEAKKFRESIGSQRWQPFTDAYMLGEAVWFSLVEALSSEARAGRSKVSLPSMVAVYLVTQMLTTKDVTLSDLLRRMLTGDGESSRILQPELRQAPDSAAAKSDLDISDGQAKEAEPPAGPTEATPEVEMPEEQLETELPHEQKSRRLRGRQPREPEMIVIPAGEFLMGSDRRTLERAGLTWGDWTMHETPSHRVYLPDYAIGRCPVTNAEYARFIEAEGYRRREFWTQAGWQAKEGNKWTQPRFWTDEKWNQASCPVVGVSWYEGVAYCRWLSQVTGRRYRLPGEAEWEKAARGPEGRIWPWGNHWDPKRCNSAEDGPGRTTPVGHYSPAGDSYYNVADMAGNVWEWCATKWLKPYPYDTREDEWGADYLAGTDVRVLRGGSGGYNRDYARCAVRGSYDPDDSRYGFGFRVVSPI